MGDRQTSSEGLVMSRAKDRSKHTSGRSGKCVCGVSKLDLFCPVAKIRVFFRHRDTYRAPNYDLTPSESGEDRRAVPGFLHQMAGRAHFWDTRTQTHTAIYRRTNDWREQRAPEPGSHEDGGGLIIFP